MNEARERCARRVQVLPWRWLRTARETKRENMRAARRVPQPFDRDHLARNDKQAIVSIAAFLSDFRERKLKSLSCHHSLLNSVSREKNCSDWNFYEFYIRDYYNVEDNLFRG